MRWMTSLSSTSGASQASCLIQRTKRSVIFSAVEMSALVDASPRTNRAASSTRGQWRAGHAQSDLISQSCRL